MKPQKKINKIWRREWMGKRRGFVKQMFDASIHMVHSNPSADRVCVSA